MILGIYLLGRAIAAIFAIVIMLFLVILCLVWMLLCAIGRALVDPDLWSRQTDVQQRQRVPPAHPRKPRNPRMYHSDRR